jgi:hypothetical protein
MPLHTLQARKTMKKIYLPLFLLLFAGITQAHPAYNGQPAQVTQPGQGCTVVYGASGDLALAGNNEDSFNPLTRAWFIPASEGHYGRVYFGYDDLSPQGGLNDQGLFFDGLYVPYKTLGASAQKEDFPGGPLAMIDEVMARSATVDEALAYFERYSPSGLEAGQLFFGDKAGNSAIVEGDTIINKKGSYQIATNFRQSETPGPPYFDGRYNTADELLSQAGSYSIELFRQIMEATRQDHYVQTVYSQVYDLKKGLIYLYLFHDFQNSIVLNLTDELAKGPHMVSVASFFPGNRNYDQWSFEQTDQWKLFYAYKIDTAVKPASLGSLVGEYRVPGDASASPVRIYLEKDQLYFQKPDELPLELYPDSASTVFHPFYNNGELKLGFQRNLLGQVTGAQVNLVYNGNEIADSYILNKTGSLSDSQAYWLVLLIALIILTILVLVIRWRRAGHKIQAQ